MQSAPEPRRTQHATPLDLYADTDLVHGQRCCADQSFCMHQARLAGHNAARITRALNDAGISDSS
jgi:hypothetical protein